MTTHGISVIAKLMAVLLAGAGSTPASAQDEQSRQRQGRVETELTPQMSELLRDFLATGEDSPELEFKVPVQFDIEIVCSFQGGRLNCGSVATNRRCPEVVDLRDPVNGTTVQAEVTCTGPSSDGYCDCEFVQ